MSDDDDVRVGDRVRWREGFPEDMDKAQREAIGTVVQIGGELGGFPVEEDEAVVRWFGYDLPDLIPLWQLEVLARDEPAH